MQGLIKNKAFICATAAAAAAAEPSAKGVKCKRSGKDEEVEKALFDWFKFIRLRNAPVNGPILIEKANKIAEASGHTNFKATEGWFSCWKKRFSVSFTTLRG